MKIRWPIMRRKTHMVEMTKTRQTYERELSAEQSHSRRLHHDLNDARSFAERFVNIRGIEVDNYRDCYIIPVEISRSYITKVSSYPDYGEVIRFTGRVVEGALAKKILEQIQEQATITGKKPVDLREL